MAFEVEGRPESPTLTNSCHPVRMAQTCANLEDGADWVDRLAADSEVVSEEAGWVVGSEEADSVVAEVAVAALAVVVVVGACSCDRVWRGWWLLLANTRWFHVVVIVVLEGRIDKFHPREACHSSHGLASRVNLSRQVASLSGSPIKIVRTKIAENLVQGRAGLGAKFSSLLAPL